MCVGSLVGLGGGALYSLTQGTSEGLVRCMFFSYFWLNQEQFVNDFATGAILEFFLKKGRNSYRGTNHFISQSYLWN